MLEAQKEIAEKSAAHEGVEDESVSNKEKLQADNSKNENFSDVSSLKEQKEDISLEQNIDRA